MRASEFLTELFQQGKDWKWSFTGSEEAVAVFHVGDIPYQFHAYTYADEDPTVWEVEFKNASRNIEQRSSKFGLTGTGNSAEVMSTIADIMREFLQRYQGSISQLTFTADEPSRRALYARMVKRLLPDWEIIQSGKNFTLMAPETVSEMSLQEFELPKNQWELIISNSDKEELGTDLVSLVKQAYHNTPQGSFVKSIRDVIPSDWNVIDWDQDPDVDSTVFYRRNRPGESWQGYKIQGLGHDGTRTSKDKAIQKIQQMLTKPGVWIESSDAMRAVLKRLSVPAVEDERLLQQLFKDPTLKMIDTDTYERQLPGGVHIRETVFGNPKLKGSV